MITLAEIRQWAENRWLEVLAAELSADDSCFPKIVKKKKFPDGTSPAQQLAILNEVRENAKQLLGPGEQTVKRGFGYTYHLAEGGRKAKDREARLIEFETREDYLRFLDREKDFAIFRKRVAQLNACFPELRNWLTGNVGKILELEPFWDRLVAVLEFFRSNPRPNLYLRELSLPVDTKFIEKNARLLDALLEEILPDEAIDREEEIFEKKYGLQWVEPLIRICFLDPALRLSCSEKFTDFGLPVRTLGSVKWPVTRVLVIENLTTLLSLRDRGLRNVIGLHGHGYRVANFSNLQWLRDCEVFYWGDIDVQGFEILSLFRRKFPHTQSLLMNRATIDRVPENSRGTGKPTRWRSEPRLREDEYEAYLWSRAEWRQIEQEHLPIDLVMEELVKRFD